MEENKQEQKLSYEELSTIASQLRAQNIQLMQALNQIQRLDYLLKILNVNSVFNKEFIEKCAEEVQSIMTVEETQETK